MTSLIPEVREATKFIKKPQCVMVKTTSHKDDLNMTLDNGTALFNYVPPYIVTEKKKHNIIRNVRIRYKVMKRKTTSQ